jgi:hypothetical protein
VLSADYPNPFYAKRDNLIQKIQEGFVAQGQALNFMSPTEALVMKPVTVWLTN